MTHGYEAGMPAHPPVAVTVTPPFAEAFNTTLDTEDSISFWRKPLVRVVAGIALAGGILAGGAALAQDNRENTSNNRDNGDAMVPATSNDAKECKDPTDSDKMIFSSDGKPNLGFEVRAEVKNDRLIATVAKAVCEEKEAVPYYAQLHPGYAYKNMTGASDYSSSKVSELVQNDEDFHKQVAQNIDTFIRTFSGEPLALTSTSDAGKELFQLLQDPSTGELYAQPVTDITDDLIVIRFTQNVGDQVEQANTARYLVVGRKADDKVLATVDTGTIILDKSQLDVSIRDNKEGASDTSTTTSPNGGNDENNDKGDKKGKKGGGNKNNEGDGEGKKDTGGKAGPDGKNPEAGPGGKTLSPANGSGPGTTEATPATPTTPGTTPGSTAPATTQPPRTTVVPTTQPPRTTTTSEVCPPGTQPGVNGGCKPVAPNTTAPLPPSGF